MDEALLWSESESKDGQTPAAACLPCDPTVAPAAFYADGDGEALASDRSFTYADVCDSDNSGSDDEDIDWTSFGNAQQSSRGTYGPDCNAQSGSASEAGNTSAAQDDCDTAAGRRADMPSRPNNYQFDPLAHPTVTYKLLSHTPLICKSTLTGTFRRFRLVSHAYSRNACAPLPKFLDGLACNGRHRPVSALPRANPRPRRCAPAPVPALAPSP
eukprot:3910489-Pleurochrysis_carterae.AAC.1